MNDSDNTPSFQNDTISSDKEEMKQNNMSWNGNKNDPIQPGCRTRVLLAATLRRMSLPSKEESPTEQPGQHFHHHCHRHHHHHHCHHHRQARWNDQWNSLVSFTFHSPKLSFECFGRILIELQPNKRERQSFHLKFSFFFINHFLSIPKESHIFMFFSFKKFLHHFSIQ